MANEFDIAKLITLSTAHITDKTSVLLDDPSKGLYIEAMIWRSMQGFSKDCVMMAVCDRPFAPGDETFDSYDEYLQALGK